KASVPAGYAVANPRGYSAINPVDAYRRVRPPSHQELLTELKNTVWSCASINAQVVAAHVPKLYVRTRRNQKRPPVATRALTSDTPFPRRMKAREEVIEEVTEHPVLELFESVNPVHNELDLFELEQLYLEIHGIAYWQVESDGAFGLPTKFWPLPTQWVTPRR